LVGKGTAANTVDIELGDTQYCEFVSNEHAVLNHIDGIWYVEDLGSLNGVGLKKRSGEYTLRLKPEVAYKIDEGDIIYISKAKIFVQ
jgi:pSer/pThr/pTyr-binding forkhead associated (FHA) protein